MKNSKVFVAGHKGLVGSAILKELQSQGYTNLVYRTHKELDLTNQSETQNFFIQEKPEYVILAAAKVGGILANNTDRADFIYQNLQIQNNVIHQSYLHKVKKLLFLGSTCVYPKYAPQPINEKSLLTAELEYTNEPYAIAKIAGIRMCESHNLQYNTNFIIAMPTNIYGINDNFNLTTSHVIPAIIKKIHQVKINNQPQVEIWEDGKAKREFLYSDDLANACVFLLENINFKDTYNINIKDIKNTHINIGTGKDISIKELALLIKDIIGFNGKLYFNTNKPNGSMSKLTDTNKASNLGWHSKVGLKAGIKLTYK